MYGEDVIHQIAFKKWSKAFEDGRESIIDELSALQHLTLRLQRILLLLSSVKTLIRIGKFTAWLDIFVGKTFLILSNNLPMQT